MPKDWLRYKAEVHRLYIVEEKTVYEVRDILREKHGFCASVRAYRMHFDEWGMKKYKSTKLRSNAASSRQLSSPPASTKSTTPSSSSLPAASPAAFTSILSMTDLRSGSEPLPEVARPEVPPPLQILGRIPFETSNAVHILESLFKNWHSRSDSRATLISYFEDIRFDKWVFRYSGPETPVILELIEKYVPEKDRFDLIKTLLEADPCFSRTCQKAHSNSWQESWCQVCGDIGWDDAKELLYDEGPLSQTPGNFLDCALIVLAEKSLEGYMINLDDWGGKPLDHDEIGQRNDCIKEFREILTHFHHAKENVNPRFYRYLVRFELQDGHNSMSSHRSYEDEYRQKYIQLTTMKAHASWKAHNGPSLVNGGDTKDTSTFNLLPPTPPTPSEPKSFSSSPVYLSTPSILDILRTKWYFLDGFEDYLESLFSFDGTQIFMFTSPHSSSENLFDSITRVIPTEEERLSLAKAILTVSSNSGSFPSRQPSNLLAWWRILYDYSHPLTYEDFRNQLLQNTALTKSLEQTISTPDGRKLFMDAAISLVGERLLGSLKIGLRRRRERTSKDILRQERYLNVLAVLRDRGLNVDKCWTVYMLDSM